MPSSPKHILIADDDADDVEMIQTLLNEVCPQLRVTVALDGVSLINVLTAVSCPDAILLDLNMPRKSGKECLKELKSTEQFKNIPIVILSTSSSKSDMEYCLTNGATFYIVKPNSYDAMKSIAEKLCSGFYLKRSG